LVRVEKRITRWLHQLLCLSLQQEEEEWRKKVKKIEKAGTMIDMEGIANLLVQVVKASGARLANLLFQQFTDRFLTKMVNTIYILMLNP
jgi:hypothetical protein